MAARTWVGQERLRAAAGGSGGKSPRAVTSSANLTGITLRSILGLMETFGKRSFFPPSRGIWRTRARCNARGGVDQVLSGGINVWCCCSCCQHWSASPEILAAGEQTVVVATLLRVSNAVTNSLIHPPSNSSRRFPARGFAGEP